MSAKHEPSPYQRKMVGRYVAAGTNRDVIAKIIGIDLKTLRKHYSNELEIATDKANGLVAGALFSNAMKGNVTAQIFWLKTRARWRETDIFSSGEDEEVTEVTITRKSAKRS